MKKINQIIIALAMALAVFTAAAQLGAPQTVINSDSGSAWTNKIVGTQVASNTAVNLTRIDMGQKKNLALQFTGKLTAAGTDPVNIVLGRNVDGSTNITPFASWAWTPSGTTTVTAFTNLTETTLGSPGGFPYIYVMYITNTTATAGLTNYTLKAYIK